MWQPKDHAHSAAKKVINRCQIHTPEKTHANRKKVEKQQILCATAKLGPVLSGSVWHESCRSTSLFIVRNPPRIETRDRIWRCIRKMHCKNLTILKKREKKAQYFRHRYSTRSQAVVESNHCCFAAASRSRISLSLVSRVWRRLCRLVPLPKSKDSIEWRL